MAPASVDRAPAVSRRRGWIVDAGALAVVVGLVVKLFFGYDRVRDVGLDDETVYEASGARLFVAEWPNGPNGLPTADTGPLYSVWYYLLSRVIHDRVTLYYVSHALVVSLLGISVFGLMRVLRVRPAWAVALTFFLLTSRLLDQWPYPTYLSAAVLVGGAFFASRARSGLGVVRALAWSFAAASFMRPEVCPAYLLLLAGLGVLGVRALRARTLTPRELAREAALCVGPFAVLGLVFGSPLGGTRSFYAFGQHYALNRVERGHLDIVPWTNWESFVHKDFGDVTTIFQALRANPSNFAWHVAANVRRTPKIFNDIFEPVLELPRGPTVWLEIAWGVLTAVGAIALVVKLLRRPRSVDRAMIGPLAALGAVLAMTLGSMLIVYPRPHYFIPLTALGGALCAACTPLVRLRAGGTLSRADTWATGVVCALALLVTPNRAYGWSPQTADQDAPAKWADLHRLRTVAELRKLRVPERIVILEPAWGFAFLAGFDFVRVAPWEKHEPFTSLLANRHINYIVIDDQLTNDGRFRSDPEFNDFLQRPGAYGFHVVDVPLTGSRIAVKP